MAEINSFLRWRRKPRHLREWLEREMWLKSPPEDLTELDAEIPGGAPPQFWDELEQLKTLDR